MKSAKGVKGFFLYNPIIDKYFFRVYESEDKKTYTDYDICVEDIEVEILDKFLCFREGKLVYSFIEA